MTHSTQIFTAAQLRQEYFPHLCQSGFDSALSRSPEQFPPHFCQPGSGRKLWLRAVVDAWLLSLQPEAASGLLKTFPGTLRGLEFPIKSVQREEVTNITRGKRGRGRPLGSRNKSKASD